MAKSRPAPTWITDEARVAACIRNRARRQAAAPTDALQPADRPETKHLASHEKSAQVEKRLKVSDTDGAEKESEFDHTGR